MTKMTGTAVAVLAACALAFAACNSTSVETPTSGSVPEPVASTSTPTPAANPSPAPTPDAGGGQEANDGYTCDMGPDGAFSVKNLTDIGQSYTAYYTSFDNQDLPLGSKESGTVPPEESWGGSFGKQCIQVDISQFGPGGLPLKGCSSFVAKDGSLFIPSRNPGKVAECRTPPPPQCEARWVVDEEPTSSGGEWGSCTATVPAFSGFRAATQSPSCSKKRTVTYTYYETNSCTQERRVSRIVQREESEKCECPPPSEPDYCFYEVTGQNKQSKCENKSGDWENWDNETHHNHCRLTYPGIADNSFNLAPGQSETGCLRKQDD